MATSKHAIRRSGVISACILLLGSTAIAAGSNPITGVDVEGHDDIRKVRIHTEREPTFTVFRLSNPMRVVVDVSGGDLSSFDGPVVVEDGVVGQIAARQFNAGGFLVGRVIVGFEKDLSYSVRAEGNSVVISTGNAPGGAVDRALPPPVAPVDRVAAERFEAAKQRADEAAETARSERRAAERAANAAQRQQSEALRIASEAERIAAQAERAKSEAESLRSQAREALARDRAEAEAAARKAEARLHQIEAQAAAVAAERASAERLALEAEQKRREAEEIAAHAEAKHKQRVASLQDQIARAEQEKKAAKAARKRADAAKREADKAVAEADRARAAAEKTRRDVTQKLAELTEREREAAALKRQAEGERLAISIKEREIDAKRREVAASKRELTAKEKAMLSQKSALEARQRQVDSMRASVSEREKAIEKRSAEIETRRRQVVLKNRQLQKKQKTVDQKAKELEAEKRRLRAVRADLERARKSVDQSRQASQGEVEAAKKKLAAAKQSLDKERAALNQERVALDEQRTTLDSERSRIDGELAKIKAKRSKLAGKDDDADRKERAALERERKKLAAQREQVEADRSALNEKQKELRAMQRKLDETSAPPATHASLNVPVEALIGAESKRPAVANVGEVRTSAPRTASSTLVGVERRKSAAGSSVLLSLHGRPSYQVLRVDDPPRLVIDLAGTERGTRRSTYGVKSPFVRRVRLGDHGDMLRAVLDLTAADAEHDISEVAQGLLVTLTTPVKRAEPAEEPTPALEATRVAKAIASSATASPAAASPAAATSARRLRDVRFEGSNDVARIVLDVAGGPDGAEPDIDDRSSKAWVLELPGTTLPKSLERSLDTTAYGTAVRLVSTYQASTDPAVVKIVANLNAPATGKVRRENGTLVWEIRAKDAPKKTIATSAAPRAAGFAAEAAVLARSTPTQRRSRNRKRISIDLQDADIVNVIRLLSEVSGENIITSDKVTGKITLKLRNVPWDTALDTILKTKGYDRVRQNNILRIAPAVDIQAERELALAKKKAEEEVEETVIKIITINYATASEIVGQLRPMLTGRGTVQVDDRTNTIIIEDIRSNIERVVLLTRRLDRQTPQVLIEARIVEANSNYLEQLGVQWGGVGQATAANGNPTGLGFPSDLIVSGAADDPTGNLSGGVSDPSRYAVNLPAPIGSGSGGGIGFVFGSAGGSQLLNLRLTALEENGNGRIISSPRITTLDNRKARIEQGIDIPVSVVSAAGVNTRFIPAVLSLEVEPHVTNDGSVLMDIRVSKNEPDFSRTGAAGDPTIIKKFAETEVLVKDGETTVIGGIYTRTKSESESRVPFLGSIPILGWLFKSTRVEDQRAELLVFITPRIVNRQASMLEQATMKSLKLEEDDGN